jgi:predicted homoserine dehydrogenase-like protein
MNVFGQLDRRALAMGRPARVAVVGTGYFGGNLIRRLAQVRGMTPAVAANRTLDRAVDALRATGTPDSQIQVCDDPLTAELALENGCSVATSCLTLAAHIPSVDVIMEATGNVVVGAEVALAAIRGGKHIVSGNPETMCTVGPILAHYAREQGVVYSDVDGDQGGMLKDLYDYVVGLGFTPVVAGNPKGVLKTYATPETQADFAAQAGIKPWIASAAADGTKMQVENAIVANATGMQPARFGMFGPQTTLETLLTDFDALGLFEHGPIVEYTLGVPAGVFMVIRSDDAHTRADLRYLKMGDGPHYLLFRPNVLVHYIAPLSAAEALLYGTATITPRGAPVAEVVAVAKRDLRAGERLDGIGGFDVYGRITTAADAHQRDLLPIGLAEFARLERDVRRDQVVPLDAVTLEDDNLVLDLRSQQDRVFGKASSTDAMLAANRTPAASGGVA